MSTQADLTLYDGKKAIQAAAHLETEQALLTVHLTEMHYVFMSSIHIKCSHLA